MSGVLLVTGGSRGIGAAVALQAARGGWKVCVNYQGNKARADAVQSLLLTDTGIDPGRVFLVAPAEGKADAAGVVMELALQ